MLSTLLYLAAALLIGYIGRDHKFTFWGWFFCSVLLTPLIASLMLWIALGVGSRDEA